MTEIDGHGLNVGDAVYVPLVQIERPPFWAFWRWVGYWRDMRAARRRAGTYTVIDVTSSPSYSIPQPPETTGRQ